MIKIIIDNVYTRIDGVSQNTELAIWNKLSFQVEEFGQENVRIRHLYNRKTKKTYTGLLPHVIDILESLDEEYDIIDNRVKHQQNANFKLRDYIKLSDGSEQKLKLRPYQREIVNRCSERETVQCATGGG